MESVHVCVCAHTCVLMDPRDHCQVPSSVVPYLMFGGRVLELTT